MVETLLGHHFTVVDALLMFALLLLVLMRLGIVIRGLEDARAELREQNRLKDELISVVSHDLRTPLTSIMGYLELVAEAEDPETARSFLEVVRRNTGRLHRLVEDLLFVSRVQSGREALELGPVRVGELVADTVAAALPVADGRGRLELSAEIATDDVVLVDAHRLTEVLENLLSNAVKFTPPGGRVSVFVGCEAESLVLRVADTGVGIAEERLARTCSTASSARAGRRHSRRRARPLDRQGDRRRARRPRRRAQLGRRRNHIRRAAAAARRRGSAARRLKSPISGDAGQRSCVWAAQSDAADHEQTTDANR